MKDQCFLSHILADDYIVVENSLTERLMDSIYGLYHEEDGKKYVLIYRKVKKQKKNFHGPKILTSYYVCLNQGEKSDWNPKLFLERWGDFSSIDTRICVSRLELLVSKSDRCRFYDNDIFTVDDFEIIEDHYHDECGFFPESFLDRVQVPPGRSSIQVRIFSGQLGIIEGMLLVKKHIEKIQITKDMVRVPPSIRNDRENRVIVVFKNCFPSESCIEIDKLLNPSTNNGEGKRKPSFYDLPRSNVNIIPSIRHLWEQLGVPKKKIEKYINGSKDIIKRQHKSVMGVVDPTRKLPEGHVFITGTVKRKNGKGSVQFGHDRECIFVARYPYLVEQDSMILPIVSRKPDKTSNDEWTSLCEMKFGHVIFATPKRKNSISISQMLGGDLDGDKYFICWNKDILGGFHRSQSSFKEKIKRAIQDRKETKMNTTKQRARKTNWFSKVHALLDDTETMMHHQELLEKTYNCTENLVKSKGIKHNDVNVAGNAYKQALNLPKHGGKISVPEDMYVDYPDHLKKHLARLPSEGQGVLI